MSIIIVNYCKMQSGRKRFDNFHQTYVSPFVEPRILGRAKRRSVFRLIRTNIINNICSRAGVSYWVLITDQPLAPSEGLDMYIALKCNNTTIQLYFTLRACSYGQKLSRLARKLFDKFTSEISPCHENNMKSYTELIWDESFPVYRDNVNRDNFCPYEQALR
jgi:hypothetical protein